MNTLINFLAKAQLLTVLFAGTAFSQEERVKLGFIGSLTSFAASYGSAVLEGAQLAAKELNAKGIIVDITVEDDQSVAKNTVNAFVKLTTLDKPQGIIGGSWWANAIVKPSEKANIPLISCETLYNQDVVPGTSYFILQGDLAQWVRVYEPLVETQAFKRGAIIRYVSGFGATLAEEMKNLFSRPGREFAGAIEYTDIQISEASSIILQLKKLNPDVVYIDAQPSGLVNILKRMTENGLQEMAIFTNSIVEDVMKEKLFNIGAFKNIYYTRRSTFDKEFSEKFEKEYLKEPYLNADLGYYAVYLLTEALKSKDPLAALKLGITVHGKRFTFNDKNVSAGIPQEIWKVDGMNSVKAHSDAVN